MGRANYVGRLGNKRLPAVPIGASPVALVAGRYLIGARLGRGGEGDTFSAVDQNTGATCALKLFRDASPAVLDRVRSEFERLAGMQHPGIVRALDLGRDKGRLFLVTELVEGASIASIAEIADEGRRRALFTRAAREVTDALAYLHGRGVIHGDVSPENVRIASDGRAVLIDHGAAGMVSTGAAVGTLGFAAPEALIGRVGPLSDLFGLGATLFLAWSGAGPFGTGAPAAARMLAAPAPRLSTVRPGLPDAWEALLDRLLQTAPERRPSSARVVLREIARLAPLPSSEPAILPPFPAGDPLAGIFVGRSPERARLKGVLDRLADGAAPHTVVAIVGAEGSGRRALIDVALQDLAIAQIAESAAPVTVFRGSVDALTDWLGVAAQRSPDHHASISGDDPLRARQQRFARLAATLETRVAKDPLCVALSPGPDESAFASFMAGAPTSGRLLLLIAVPEALSRVGALDLSLPPLSANDVQSLATRALGESPPEAAIIRVTGASAGHAATAAVLCRQLVEVTRRNESDTFVPTPEAGFEELLKNSLRRLPGPVRRLLAEIALGLGVTRAPRDHVDDFVEDLRGARPWASRAADGDPPWAARVDAARAAGWVWGDSPDIALPSRSHEAVVRRALVDSDLQEVARRALRQLPDPDGRRGICLEALGQLDKAAVAFHAAAQGELVLSPDNPVLAARWLEEAARLDPGSLDVDQRLLLTMALALQGRAEAALAFLDSAAPGPLISELDQMRLIERQGWLMARAGDLEGARRTLEHAIADAAPRAVQEGTVLPRARLARVLVSMGRFAEAIAVAGPFITDPTAGSVAIESVLLAHAYVGDLQTARRLHADLATRRLPPARTSYLAALLDHLSGDLLAALAGYRRALPDAESAGDIHTVAAIALNVAALAAEAGRYDEALLMQDRAIRDLGRLGATAELGTALFNAGMLLAEIGDLAGARGMLGRLRREIAGRATFSDASMTYLEGELALREGNETEALDLFTRAAQPSGSGTGIRLAADLARAELLARGHRSSEANAILDRIEVGAEAGASNPRTAAELRLARARILLVAPALDVDAVLRLAPAVDADAKIADGAGRKPRAFRGALAAARLFHRAGRAAEASASLHAARRLFEEIRMSTPIDHHAGIEQDPDARFLGDLARLVGGGDDPGAGARAARSARSEDRLRRLLRINKRLNSELRLPRLLELIMDTVIELTEAERGFILLEDEKGELTVKVARNIDQQTLETGAFDLSRSIARQAAAGGGPIVTIDAAGDPRFREALSVSDLHLRSVLAVPLHVKGRAVGTLYVDNRLRKGAFGDDDVQLVLDFSEQAGIAIENARLLTEVRRRERQIEVLNRRLEGELAVRKEELVGMKQELRENREALAIRYDYRNIVGRTPRMLDLFRLLDRLTDTVLPVVIQGESGTGKELVARALHFNGPRRDRPFVSENCAAIPETLLESTLFGAVRGAYTGADHDSRGLFEVADGGTLFLDEVGEMSPGMQGKLLRVLQAGELRRVGSERMRKVDVRIIAATNRDLGRMVEEGKFRQDLFFRLSVAPILLPPLRDRREDIPAIVEHILGKMLGKTLGKTSDQTPDKVVPHKRVDPDAMARLGAYRWPGNVRELENEIMRAVALSGDRITVSDLSPQIAGNAEAALTTLEDPDSLTLRPRVERLERALLREALSRSGGNQTRAAEALGLSRFGLQKKMRRYQIG